MTSHKSAAGAPVPRPAGRGRPTARNPLIYHVAVRLTEADGRRLDELADRLNRDRAELVRGIVLDGLGQLEAKK